MSDYPRDLMLAPGLVLMLDAEGRVAFDVADSPADRLVHISDAQAAMIRQWLDSHDFQTRAQQYRVKP